ncbi:ribosomal protein S7 domain-containing protein [Dipodascopsis uninucleata]
MLSRYALRSLPRLLAQTKMPVASSTFKSIPAEERFAGLKARQFTQSVFLRNSPKKENESSDTDAVAPQESVPGTAGLTDSSPEAEQGTPVTEILKKEPEIAPEVIKHEIEGHKPHSPDLSNAEESDLTELLDPEIDPVLESKLSSGEPESSALVEDLPSDLHKLAFELIKLNTSGVSIEEYTKENPSEFLQWLSEDIREKKKLPWSITRPEELTPDELKLTEYGQRMTGRKLREFPILKNEEDPVISHLINMIMRDGKKSKAQRIVSEAFIIVRLRLKRDPRLVLHEIVDKLSPLVKIVKVKSGAKTFSVPKALNRRQRNRRALEWLLEEAAKKPSPSFSVRLGDAITSLSKSVASGQGIEKRDAIHKTAMENRVFIKSK